MQDGTAACVITPVAIFQRKTVSGPQRVNRAAEDHEDGKENEEEPSSESFGRKNIPRDLPETEDAKARGERPDQTASIESSIGSVGNGVDEPSREIGA